MNGKSIVVAGAGGNIGSHFCGFVARMPEVRRVVLIDRDVYERGNLVSQNIVPHDVGAPKAQIQARRLAEIRPELEVVAVHSSLEDLPLSVWRADLIVACLDSRAARQAVNERAWRLGVPWIDSGVLGSESLARVNAYAPADDAPCLECAWSGEDYLLLEQRYPCADGAAVATAPTGASSELGGLAAAMLAMECRKMLAGRTDCALIGRQATFNGQWNRYAITMFRRNPNCRLDHATWHIEPLACSTRKMRVDDLLAMGETVRVPGHSFARRLVCAACGSAKQLFHLASSLDASARRCAQCRKTMNATGFDIVEALDETLPAEIRKRTLQEVGLRRGDVIETSDRHFEIEADAVIAN